MMDVTDIFMSLDLTHEDLQVLKAALALRVTQTHQHIGSGPFISAEYWEQEHAKAMDLYAKVRGF